jgi:thiol-disulfide isomerase/thioredoxin
MFDMKKTFFFFFLICLIGSVSVPAQTTVVNNPYWSYAKDYGPTLRKVIQQPSETILSMDIHSLVSWRLKSTVHLEAAGKTYACKGGRLFKYKKGKMEEVPFVLDSLNASSTFEQTPQWRVYPDSLLLSFEPLPANTRTFDFIEYKGDEIKVIDAWNIYGVKMDGKPYPPAFAAWIKNVNTTLPVYTPRHAKTVLTVHIRGYRKDMEPAYKWWHGFQNILTEKINVKQKVDSMGNLRLETASSIPVSLTLTVLNIEYPLLLVPGSSLNMVADAAAISALARRSDDERDKALTDGTAFRLKGKYASLNEVMLASPHYNSVDYLMGFAKMTFKEYVDEIWKNCQTELKEIRKNRKYDAQQRDYLKLAAQNTYLKYYIGYAKRMQDCIYWCQDSKIPGADTLKLDQYQAQFTLKDIHAKELGLFKDIRALYVLNDCNYLDYMEANGITSGEVYQWMMELKKAKTLATHISLLNPVKNAAGWKGIAPQYLPALKQLNDTIIKNMKELQDRMSNIHIRQIPKVSPDKLIQTIVDKYRGKVVMVDCWATWCGPCKRGIAGMEPIKKKFKGKDVVFVYLTDESSDGGTWSKSIKEIPGYHYRMPSDVWQKIPGLDAIPHYYFFDRNGNMITEQEGWQNDFSDRFKEIIEKAL